MKKVLTQISFIARLILLSVTLPFVSVASAGVYPYAEFKDTITPKTVEILKKHGMPVALDREDPWFAISGVPGNYTVWLHRSDEIPQQAILDIVKLCMDFYQQRGRKETFRLLIYRESREEWRKSLLFGIGYFARIKPFFELNIEGAKP